MQQSCEQNLVLYPEITTDNNKKQQLQQQQQQQQQPTTITTTIMSPPRVRRFSARHRLFKAGTAGLIFAVFLFAVGFAAPSWYGGHGLWITCRRDPVICGPDGDWMLIGWKEAVRTLEVLAMMGFLLSLAVELYQDVLTFPPPPDNRAVETLAFSAGVLGLAGLTVYGTAGLNYYKEERWYNRDFGLSWGYFLTLVACLLAILCAAVLAWGRRRHTSLTTQVLAQPAFPLMACDPSATPKPVGLALGPPATSLVPVCYVIVQGQLVPAFKEMTSEDRAALEEAKSEP